MIESVEIRGLTVTMVIKIIDDYRLVEIYIILTTC